MFRGGGQIVAPDEEMASAPNEFITRQAQDFSDTYEWGSSWNLDCASTVWIPPLPTGVPNIIPGTIATFDSGLDASPLVTATVKADPGGLGSQIHLRLDDITMNSAPDFERVFSAPPELTGLEGDPFCRHPTVEVAYWRVLLFPPQPQEGRLMVYVVWSQLSKADDTENWDLYGMHYRFAVHPPPVGIDFDPIEEFGPYLVPGTQSWIPTWGDELEPDLALMANGDLLLAYMETKWSVFHQANIMAIRADWNEMNPDLPPVMQTRYTVASSYNNYPPARNLAPSVDVGRVNAFGPMNQYTAVCVWFMDFYGNPYPPVTPYYVCGAHWNALSDQPPGQFDRFTLTTGEGIADVLPKVDIAPPPNFPQPGSPDPFREAVIAWTHCDYSWEQDPPYTRHFSNPRIQMTVTPLLTAPFYEVPSVNGIAPDIACYERSSPDQDQWFAVSFYKGSDDGEMPWDWENTSIRSYSYDELFGIEPQYTTSIDYEPAFWELEAPFTGSALSLRDPSQDDVGNPPEPINDVFGASMIQGTEECTSVWVSEGSIYP